MSGWDLSLIYYDAADKIPVFFQRRLPQPASPDAIALEPRHPRMHIVGATLTKSLEPVVLRSEVALTIGKRYETTNLLDSDGVVRRDTSITSSASTTPSSPRSTRHFSSARRSSSAPPPTCRAAGWKLRSRPQRPFA